MAKSSTRKPSTTAYNKAVSGLARMKTGAKRLKAKSTQIMDDAGHAVVVGTTAYGAGYAEGRMGPEKLKVAGYDVRAPTGIVLATTGVMLRASGKRLGTLVQAAGEGLFASYASSAGNRAGQQAAQKAATAAPAEPTTTVGGDVREVHLLGGVAPGQVEPDPAVGATPASKTRDPAFLRAELV